jgi:purine-cytosine permease-like protein
MDTLLLTHDLGYLAAGAFLTGLSLMMLFAMACGKAAGHADRAADARTGGRS